ITWVNPAFTRLTGYAAAEVLGQTPRFLKSGKHEAAFYRSMWETILAGQVWQGELINLRKDATLYTEDQTITPIFNDRGEISHFISIKQDATERKQAEQQRIRALQLQAENEALARADRLKSEFLADMSHEFRTPLNSILGFSELLLEICQNLTREQQEDLRLIYQSAQNLLHLVNDALDLARIEAGHVKLERDVVPLKDTFARILDVFSPRLQQNNLKGSAEVHPPELAVFADSRRLEQILTNLVGNAVKFTGRGGITLSARTAEGGVLVSVADTGVGIPAEELPHIFNKFYQARKQTESATRGTGLGLAITRQLVELHGGRIWAQSTPGEGTTVSFVLPGEEAAQSVRAKEQGRVASAHRAGG
ncbi:MAG: PAS domain-containing sensor histidine kinase, partial [Candidatus Acidiferrales bacterium]